MERKSNSANTADELDSLVHSLNEMNTRVAEHLEVQTQVENALRDKKMKYSALFEGESDAILVFDGNTLRIEEMNHAAIDLFGYTSEELQERTLVELVSDQENTDIELEVVKSDRLSTPAIHSY